MLKSEKNTVCRSLRINQVTEHLFLDGRDWNPENDITGTGYVRSNKKITRGDTYNE